MAACGVGVDGVDGSAQFLAGYAQVEPVFELVRDELGEALRRGGGGGKIAVREGGGGEGLERRLAIRRKRPQLFGTARTAA